MRGQGAFVAVCVTLSCFLSISNSLNTTLHSPSHHPCLPHQKTALLEFKNDFQFLDCLLASSHDPYPKVRSWNDDTDCCSWDGVTCDAESGFVIGLSMRSSCLWGPLESRSSLFKLHHLRKLDLSDNNFKGYAIPAEIAQFEMLSHFNLSYSGFSKRIPPQLTQLGRLVSLDLSTNDLYFKEGDFKALIQNARRLTELHLGGVSIPSRELDFIVNSSSLSSLNLQECYLVGKFPESILALSSIRSIDLKTNPNLLVSFIEFHPNSSLELLDLSYTNCSGNLLDSIGNLKSLSHMGLGGCNFQGNIPLSLRNLSQLNYLDLSSNGITDSFLPSLGYLRKLRILDLTNNSLSGEIPSQLGNLTELEFLRLSVNNLEGQVPSSFRKLRKLAFLDLAGNKLKGACLDVLKNLTQLQELSLSGNKFTGQIPPSIKDLSSLSRLDLSHNLFSGSLPPAILTISPLMELILLDNQLNGSLESPFGFENMSSELIYLDLGINDFEGHFPRYLSNFTKLQHLVLSHSRFRGQVPKSLWVMPFLYRFDMTNNYVSGLEESLTLLLHGANLSTLRYLYMSNNSFEGNIPRSLSRFTNLVLLHLAGNKFEGAIPKSILDMPHLLSIDIGFNSISSFEGSLSSNIEYLNINGNKFQGGLPILPLSITHLFAAGNNFSGEIPQSICELTSLQMLDLSYNQFGGAIPQCLVGFSTSLSLLQLRCNNLRGMIPRAFNSSSNLRTIDLGNNQLVGKLPRSLVNCKHLEILDLENNWINDTFPSWLVELPELQVLVLRANRLHGPISIPLRFPKLRIIDISSNAFAGPIPSDYFESWTQMAISNGNSSGVRYMGDKLKYYQDTITLEYKGNARFFGKIPTIFTMIDFSDNRFEREIPKSIGQLEGLIVLNLSHNSFTGPILSSLANLKNLESLDLSKNKLYGKIPSELEGLSSLAVMNFSYNQLTGPIPQSSQFTTQPSSSFEGNLGLFGCPLLRCGDTDSTAQQNHNAATQHNLESEELINWAAAAIGYLLGLILGLAIGHIITSNRHD